MTRQSCETTAKACNTCAWFVTGCFGGTSRFGADAYGICVLGANDSPYAASQIRMAPDEAAEQIRCKADCCKYWKCEKEDPDAQERERLAILARYYGPKCSRTAEQ